MTHVIKFESTPVRATGTPSSPPRRHPRGGFTLVEIMMVFILMAISIAIFSSTVASTSSQREQSRRQMIAVNAARNIVEEMRNMPFKDIYATYNSRADDDPSGAGTAPGMYFDVEGLEPAQGDSDGFVGTVVLPETTVSSGGSGLVSGVVGVVGGLAGGGASGGNPGDPVVLTALREDCDLPEIGLPRDLNGDSVVDSLDHSHDYAILPVMIRIEWSMGRSAQRIEISTQLADFNVN